METNASWYIYRGNTQLGPFFEDQVQLMINMGMVSSEDWGFTEGFENWVLFSQIPQFTGHTSSGNGFATNPQSSAQNCERAGRTTFDGQIILHNDEKIAFCKIVNVSKSGVFVATNEMFFENGGHVNVTIKSDLLSAAINMKGSIARQGTVEGYKGYGIRFERDCELLDIQPDFVETKQSA